MSVNLASRGQHLAVFSHHSVDPEMHWVAAKMILRQYRSVRGDEALQEDAVQVCNGLLPGWRDYLPSAL